jgi:dimethylargininase
MRVFDFNHAIIRAPGQSVVQGLRDDPQATPRYEAVAEEHRVYVSALRELGLTITDLPALEAFPDSVFVEDPALVFSNGAILLRSGAPSRLGERDAMRETLKQFFDTVLELDEGEYCDGGDVLVTPEAVFIGLSKRTNRAGAEALCGKLDQLGLKGKIAQTPPGILHFKTAASLLSEDTLMATRTMAVSNIFDGFRVLVVPDGEENAANLLRINDTVLMGEDYPGTRDMIASEGLDIRTLPVREIAKLDASLTCMSLRWWDA